MKGIILTQFLDYVAEGHGQAFVETLIADARPPSGGAYTAVGTYPAAELESLLAALAARAGVDRARALRGYGAWLYPRLAGRYAAVVGRHEGMFELLRSLHGVIHVEVRKLYPDAELPRFDASDDGPGRMLLRYESSRRMADFAEGLLEGCAAWFGERVTISRDERPDGSTLFRIERCTTV